MNYYKQLGKNRKKDELPSFLVGLTDAPEDITFAPKPTPSTHYLGPIFVGLCTNYQHHAPPHSLKLGTFHQPQFTVLPGADDISKLLYAHTKADKVTQTMFVNKRTVKHPKTFKDIYPHKCTGSKKMFVPDVTPHVIDLGKTQSIIEGEASVEIPLSRHQNLPFRYRRKSIMKRDNGVITLSDIREEKRMFMSYKERISHAHFPKEFRTVRVIGPTIPASITITKLPSKRKTESQLTLEIGAQSQSQRKIEAGAFRRKSTKSKSVVSTSSKKFSKLIEQNSEDLRKAEEEVETRGEVFDEMYSVREEEEAGEKEEEEEGEGEEEIYGEGAEEIEGEKEEVEEEGKEEEEEEKEEEEEEEEETKTEERKETKTEVKEEAKIEVKEEPKTEVKEEAKIEVKEEPKIEVKEEPKTEEKEEVKTEVKEENTKVVPIKEEEAVNELNAKVTNVTESVADEQGTTSTVLREANE